MGGWPKGARCDVHVDAEFLRFWIGDARQPVPTPTGSIPLAAKIDCGTGDQNIGGRRQVQRRAHSRAVDRGDRRQRAVRDRKEAVIDSVQTILGRLACTSGLASAASTDARRAAEISLVTALRRSGSVTVIGATWSSTLRGLPEPTRNSEPPSKHWRLHQNTIRTRAIQFT